MEKTLEFSSMVLPALFLYLLTVLTVNLQQNHHLPAGGGKVCKLTTGWAAAACDTAA